MVSKSNGVRRLQVYGDSILVIERMKKKKLIHNVTLQPIATQIKSNSLLFEIITFNHIYKEMNMDIDSLSK